MHKDINEIFNQAIQEDYDKELFFSDLEENIADVIEHQYNISFFETMNKDELQTVAEAMQEYSFKNFFIESNDTYELAYNTLANEIANLIKTKEK